MKQIISIKEAANISGLSEYAVRVGIKQGIFPAFQFNGGKYHIPTELFSESIKALCIGNGKKVLTSAKQMKVPTSNRNSCYRDIPCGRDI